MQRHFWGISNEPRSQLVPSPSQSSDIAHSPLSLENWYMPDFECLKENASDEQQQSPQNSTTGGSNKNPFSNMFGSSCCETTQTTFLVDASNLQTTGRVLYSPSSVSEDIKPRLMHPVGSPSFYEDPSTPGFTNGNGSCGYIGGFRIKTEAPDPVTNNTHSSSCQLSVKDCQLFQNEHLQSLALEEASKEIGNACRDLSIAADPHSWNADNVRSWIAWSLKEEGFKYPMSLLDSLHMEGVQLCGMSESDFRRLLPQCGDKIFAKLEIWKAASNFLGGSSLSIFRPEESFIDLNRLLNLWPSDDVSPSSSPPLSSPRSVLGSPAGPVSLQSPNGDSLEPVLSPVRSYGSEGITSEDEGMSDENGESDRCATGNGTRPGSHSHIHLWQFLKELLNQPQSFGSCIRWLDRSSGVFKIEDSVRVARLWGKRKNRPAMNYDKLSRSIRQYYRKGIMKKTERSQRLVYQFCHPYGL